MQHKYFLTAFNEKNTKSHILKQLDHFQVSLKLSIFFNAELQHFHSDSVPRLSNKNAHTWRSQMTNKILSHKLLKLIIFQPMERHRSWDSVLILISWVDTNDLKTRNTHARRAMKIRFGFEYESSFSLSLDLDSSTLLWITII